MLVGIVGSIWLGFKVAYGFATLLALWRGLPFDLGSVKMGAMPIKSILGVYALLIPIWICAYGAIDLGLLYLNSHVASAVIFVATFVAVLLSVVFVRFGGLAIKMSKSLDAPVER